MRTYECIFVYAPNASPEDRKGQEANLKALVQKFEGKIVRREEMGRRQLAYEVKKTREGYFVIADLDLKPEKIDDLRKAFQLDSDIIKFSVIRKDERLEEIREKEKKREKEKAAQEKAEAETAGKGA